MIEFDFISLSETWMNEEGWNRIKAKLSKTHVRECREAEKDKKKGRAKGEFLIAKSKGWGIRESRLVEWEEDRLILTEIKDNKETITVISI